MTFALLYFALFANTASKHYNANNANAIAQNSENAIMQKTIMLKRKCNRDAKRETRENFREYTFTIGG